MELFMKLFSSQIGILSMFTIGFIIVMAIFMYIWVGRQARLDEKTGEND